MTQVKGFFGPEGSQQGGNVLGSAFGGQKFSCGYIQKSHACAKSLGLTSTFFHNVNRRKPIVFSGFQDLIVQGDPWGDHFGDPALDDGLGGFGIFKLVTNRHTVACSNQFG